MIFMKSIYISCIIACIVLIPAVDIVAQTTYNYEVKDKSGNLYLLGKTTRQRLQQAPYDSWFNQTYSDYAVDSASANQLKSMLKGKRFVIFMGTWCGDSRREVPRMYKLLDYCGVAPSQIELINVDFHDSAYKQSPTHEEKGLQIHRVPDLLVYERNKEIGRVVESPVISWEKDLLAILQGQAYVPRYKAVHHLAALFESSTVQNMATNMQQLADQLRALVQNRGELNSYGYIQLSLKDMDKALLIFRLNTLLFPNEISVWNTLTEASLKFHNAAR
jgi:thiol-disulfide isomerase/thioredoxin